MPGTDEKQQVNEACFHKEEASIILQAFFVDPVDGNEPLRTRAQELLLLKALARGIEVDSEDLTYITSHALEEIRDALIFVFELQIDREGDFYGRLSNPETRGDNLVIMEMIKAYLLHKSSLEPDYQFRFTISRWAEDLDDKWYL